MFEVDACFVHVHTIKVGPQRGTRYKVLPPSSAYVGECDDVFVFAVHIPGVWKESEDFGRDPVDWGKSILQGSN